MPHIIRLRGPWSFQPLARLISGPGGSLIESTENLPPDGTTELEATWDNTLEPGFRGIVRFTRRFHCPTGLTSETKVWLVIDRFCGRARVLLNDTDIGDIGDGDCNASDFSTRFDITALLQAQNLIAISVKNDGKPKTPGPHSIGSVQLEIGDHLVVQ